MQSSLRWIVLMSVMLFVAAVAPAQASGTWSVNASDHVDIIAANVSTDRTYRIAVTSGQGEVEVIVRNQNGDKVTASSRAVEAGDSSDFDLEQGWSIEVKYKTGSSTGTYLRL